MEIRDWSKIKKAIGFPKSEIRKAFDGLTVALSQEPDNQLIRFVRVYVALELARKFPTYLAYPPDDLSYLCVVVDSTDSVRTFFVQLLYAKYYCLALERGGDRNYSDLAKQHLDRAEQLACRDFYRDEVKFWRKRVDNVQDEQAKK
jgi:hypothetical protein